MGLVTHTLRVNTTVGAHFFCATLNSPGPPTKQVPCVRMDPIDLHLGRIGLVFKKRARCEDMGVSPLGREQMLEPHGSVSNDFPAPMLTTSHGFEKASYGERDIPAFRARALHHENNFGGRRNANPSSRVENEPAHRRINLLYDMASQSFRLGRQALTDGTNWRVNIGLTYCSHEEYATIYEPINVVGWYRILTVSQKEART